MCFLIPFREDFKTKKKNNMHCDMKRKKSHFLEVIAKFDYKLRVTCDCVI